MAARGGLKTVLFEKKALGGVCLNEGCIPTKALLNSAKIFAAAREGERFGVNAPGISLDHAAAMAHKARTIKTLVGGVEMKMKKAGVAVVPAAVKITGAPPKGASPLRPGIRISRQNGCSSAQAPCPCCRRYRA